MSVCIQVYLSVCLVSVCIQVYLSVCLVSVCIQVYLSVCLVSVCIQVYLSVCLVSVCIQVYLSVCLVSVCIQVYLSVCLVSVCIQVYLSVCLVSVCIQVYLSVCLVSVCIQVHLSVCLVSAAVCRYWRDMALNVWKGRRELVCNGFSFYMRESAQMLFVLSCLKRGANICFFQFKCIQGPSLKNVNASFPASNALKDCLFFGCLTSQQHASVSQGQSCSDKFTCCHTEIEVADQTFHLTQSQYTDTGPTSPSTDPVTPGTWQGSHWSANF